MTMIKSATLAAVLCTSALAAGLHAEPAASATDKPTPAAMRKTMSADDLAKLADCTKQANAKKLHGTERAKFREECKKK